jgi:hypothetical protein
MIGRAGRGNLSGRGWIVGAAADAEAMAELLCSGCLDDLRPPRVASHRPVGEPKLLRKARPLCVKQGFLNLLHGRRRHPAT